jgi:hypothetical protein
VAGKQVVGVDVDVDGLKSKALKSLKSKSTSY